MRHRRLFSALAALASAAVAAAASAQTPACDTQVKASEDAGWNARFYDVSTITLYEEPATLGVWETKFFRYSGKGLSLTVSVGVAENAASTDIGTGLDMQIYVGGDRKKMAFEEADYAGAEFWLDGKIVARLPDSRDGSSFPRGAYMDNFVGEIGDVIRLRDALKTGRPVTVVIKQDEPHGSLRVPDLTFGYIAQNLPRARTELRRLMRSAQTGRCTPFRKPSEREVREQIMREYFEEKEREGSK